MKRIDGYIFRTVAVTTLVALFVMLALDVFFNVLREVEHLGEGSYNLLALGQFLLLTLPRRIYETMPMSLLVGGLLGMGTLASSSELVVMRAAGLSILRLGLAVLQAGLVLSLAALLLGEFVAPQTEYWAQSLRSDARERQMSFSGGDFWARDGNFYVNIQRMESGFRLSGIAMFEVDEEANLKSLLWAESAHFQDGQWILQGVSRSRLETASVLTDVDVETAWHSMIKPSMLQVLAADPEDLSLRDLDTFIDYLRTNALDTREYELAYWTKIVAPFANLAMLIIGLPFVFGSQRKAGAGQRLLIGVLLGLAFFLLNRLLGNMVMLYGFHPLLGASTPTVIFVFAGGLALARLR